MQTKSAPAGCEWVTTMGRAVLIKRGTGEICGGNVPRSWHGQRLVDRPWERQGAAFPAAPEYLGGGAFTDYLKANKLKIVKETVTFPFYGFGSGGRTKKNGEATETGYTFNRPEAQAFLVAKSSEERVGGRIRRGWSIHLIHSGYLITRYISSREIALAIVSQLLAAYPVGFWDATFQEITKAAKSGQLDKAKQIIGRYQ